MTTVPAPRTHPPEDLLLAHASGESDPAMRVLLEAHLDLCADCRAAFAELAAPGGWLLAQTPEEKPSAAVWEALERRLASPPPPDLLPAEVPLPAGARAELDLRQPPRWVRLFLRGAKMSLLFEDEGSKSWLGLGRMPGGKVFPRHLHTDFEHAVVLSGGYADERGDFEAGDFAVYEPGSEHGPDTLEGQDCWILFRLAGPVEFRGWRGVLQRLFTRG
ncbi:MAG: cupin domain-containing protein [Thermoanaerobaculia bacterium]